MACLQPACWLKPCVSSTSASAISSLASWPDHNRAKQAWSSSRAFSAIGLWRSGRKHSSCAAATSSASSGDELTSSSASSAGNRSLSKTRRDMLLEYVQNVQPEFMELFIQKAPQQVVEAMRKTVTNMLGTLPPQFFEITITTVAENLAQLMYSVLMTGYMFRNAQYRIELQQSLEQAALPAPKDEKFGPEFESKVQKSQVQGSVLKWHKEDGPVAMDAVEYIEFLESEVEKLQQQLERGKVSGQNELLDYLKNLEPKNLQFLSSQELTTSAGEDAVEAMNTFVQRLIRISDAAMLKRTATETSAKELARLLYWLMVVGYSIRNIEVRYDMERILGMPAKHPELPPGETM
ncbi:uncharacterized protein LOC9663352 isoform X1 [Selaginella moellendorffii]|uniref:uncharacterized protein LOC9663352 isoform X1 n=1 Tax=Selaginella moellendorffii TaxID=88036 RepID=UPI000D1C5744|nr:uncharacterized protein LOC9663352 isoform X1 [Selaginella moellendorffii]|eukprot:XP_024522935.1 uncharacterized protein LOC9663352 isoform X1 [Selaginella moellendorffii]